MQENIKQVTVKRTVRMAFRTEPIWQYDVGHELVFDCFELPTAFEVHFSRSPMGQSITQIGTENKVTLPDMYAQSAGTIYAWLYIADTDTGLTKYSIEIPVNRRAKITDQQPTPVEQSAIDQAISALNAGVDAAEDAQAAAEVAQAAAELAQSVAELEADAAEEAKLAAQGFASAADGSATEAGQSATAAGQSATAAAGSASDAEGSASAAAQTKSEIDDEVTGFQAQIDDLDESVSDVLSALSDLENDVTAIENLSSSQETGLLSPFVQGTVSQTTGNIDTTATGGCYIGQIPMNIGDSVKFERSVNKITLSPNIVIYDKDGNFIKGGQYFATNPYTFDVEGMFAITAYLNTTVSATMEEAIAAANTSFKATLSSKFPIVEKIDELDERVSEIEDLNLEQLESRVDAVEDGLDAVKNMNAETEVSYPVFTQGGYDGHGEPEEATNVCRSVIFDVSPGDTLVYARAVNTIKQPCTIFSYNESGEYIRSATTPDATITFNSKGQFAIVCAVNDVVQATMEQAIASANASFTLTRAIACNIVKAVNELDERVEAIEESGVAETAEKVEKFAPSAGLDLTSSDLKKGFYYKVENGVVSKVTEAPTNYIELVDVSDLIGQHLIVESKTRRAGSIRSFGFCDAQNNVGNYATETGMAGMYTGIYRRILLVDKPYFFFSMSSDATDISIRIEPKYDFYEKRETDFRLDSQKFYHLSFDDVIACMQDITTNEDTYESVFENDFFGWCKKMHDIYGTTFSMYVFYANDASNPTWTLENCTDAFADEFKANADWLRFGFHAYAQGTTATSREGTIATDYANTITQLVRITGSVKCIDRMPRLQSYTGTLTALKAIRDCDLGCIGFIASANESASTRRDSYYFTEEQNAYIDKHIYMYDAENNLHFVKTTYCWGGSTLTASVIEQSAQWFNANRYVELFMHENQLTSGQKSSFESKINALCYEHLPIFMMDKVLTS